ncbi:hypothetical protein GCM10010472_26130 [Pseudonocardia halophobica]|uniref:Uncharacterized protein n=1 Tax=Pseudonocardia halophobica TaxID=29401 RepID=A0A9W6KX49_9PSEU|nr:hypothetical protein [Pseudonocardia halophobica]GLL08872.1 hypothetical protein GCM10017577_00120 [Pseudonocardia halophobica]
MVSRQPPVERHTWTAAEQAELDRRARARRRVLGLAGTDRTPGLDVEGGPELVEVVGPEAAGIPSPAEEPVVVEVPEPRAPS